MGNPSGARLRLVSHAVGCLGGFIIGPRLSASAYDEARSVELCTLRILASTEPGRIRTALGAGWFLRPGATKRHALHFTAAWVSTCVISLRSPSLSMRYQITITQSAID